MRDSLGSTSIAGVAVVLMTLLAALVLIAKGIADSTIGRLASDGAQAVRTGG